MRASFHSLRLAMRSQAVYIVHVCVNSTQQIERRSCLSSSLGFGARSTTPVSQISKQAEGLRVSIGSQQEGTVCRKIQALEEVSFATQTGSQDSSALPCLAVLQRPWTTSRPWTTHNPAWESAGPKQPFRKGSMIDHSTVVDMNAALQRETNTH